MMIRKIFIITVFSFFYYLCAFIPSFAGVARDYMYDDSNLLSINNILYEEDDDNDYNHIRYKKKTKRRKNKGFIRTYIFPEENQIFGKNKHLISLFGGYCGTQSSLVNWLNSKTYHGIQIYSRSGNEIDNPGDGYSMAMRKSFNFSLSYSIPLNIFFINGRLTIGIFGMYINQNILRNDYWYFIPPRVQGKAIRFAEDYYYTYIDDEGYKIKVYVPDQQRTVNGWFSTYTLGVEGIYELIFGHPNLYLTIGFGFSYLFILSQNAKTDNENFNDLWKYRSPAIMWNNSRFNWVIKASVGHRFDCGLIIEANWKHYSNGELSTYNWGFNFFGGTIGFVF